MNGDLRIRLREAFEIMSGPVQPPAGLAHRVRLAARRRRHAEVRGLVAAIAVVAVLVAVAVEAGQHAAVRRVSPDGGPATLNIPVTAGYTGLAVGGAFLYVATGDGPSSALTAYSRTTGQLVRRVHIPAAVTGLNVGPGGAVWVTFSPDQNGGAVGLWLLSADLGQHSGAGVNITGRLGLSDVLPTSSTTALAGGPTGLDELRMPAPGRPGVASLQQVSTVPNDQHFLSLQLARLAGGIAVLQGDEIQYNRIMIVGSRAHLFAPAGVDIVAMTAQGGGLWVATSPQPTGPPYGSVIRLGPQLQVQTPRLVAADPDLRFTTGLGAYGHTVWVATDSLSRSLFCFRFTAATGAGPITYVPTRSQAGLVTATADFLYVADALGVTSYRVPRACS